ncbi:hypothetical protein F2P81_001216 [Scophthalmus maximus]|uniref:Uncharacterized protein n=1 Tax=Scophthalmus maximus TaxID=52904 RepID=A0A6A4TN28_SCOMX|nr:hypothetical protein F2P81_001216 [Scophthalmus maximus]
METACAGKRACLKRVSELCAKCLESLGGRFHREAVLFRCVVGPQKTSLPRPVISFYGSYFFTSIKRKQQPSGVKQLRNVRRSESRRMKGPAASRRTRIYVDKSGNGIVCFVYRELMIDGTDDPIQMENFLDGAHSC